MTEDVVLVNKAENTVTKAKRRPARTQLDPATVIADNKPSQTGQEFNLWYSKWTGGETNGKALLTHSKTRCNIRKDSGYTRADKHTEPDSINRSKFMCLYFARGYCCNGKNCEYLHRLPTDLDFFPPTLDCFGREKFSTYRDDMSGIGSFNRINKTLYVGRINSMEGNIELLVSKNFGEFGDIERSRLVKEKKIAFVTYKLESQAQFAKEALHGQSLNEDDQNEAMNIRWANEDPDPKAQKRNREDIQKTAIQTAQKLLNKMRENEENELKRQKVVVEEPESDDYEDGDEQQKTLPSTEFTPTTSFIRNDSLNVLKRLQQKRAAVGDAASAPPQQQSNALQSMLGGYDSSEDEDK